MASPSGRVLHAIVLSCGREQELSEKRGKILCSRRRGRHEFIASDFRGNAHSAVLGGLDTHNLSQAADVYIARLRDLLRKSNDEFNFVANLEIGSGEEI